MSLNTLLLEAIVVKLYEMENRIMAKFDDVKAVMDSMQGSIDSAIALIEKMIAAIADLQGGATATQMQTLLDEATAEKAVLDAELAKAGS